MRVTSRICVAVVAAALSTAALSELRWSHGVDLLYASRADAQQTASDSAGQAVRAGVEAVLRTQAEAWNRGDVDAFVEHYWKSDDLTFSSGGKTTRGWAPTRDRYRERYPTPEVMGRLTFDNLEVTPLGDAAAMVLGEWALARDAKPIGGNFTLVMRKVDGRWLIIHDHTSQLAE